jgi:hypothetical protein
MKDVTFQLFKATIKVKELVLVHGDTQPVAVVFGRSLGWKWPEGMNQYEAGWVARLCDLLNVNLPGRPPAVR